MIKWYYTNILRTTSNFLFDQFSAKILKLRCSHETVLACGWCNNNFGMSNLLPEKVKHEISQFQNLKSMPTLWAYVIGYTTLIKTLIRQHQTQHSKVLTALFPFHSTLWFRIILVHMIEGLLYMFCNQQFYTRS